MVISCVQVSLLGVSHLLTSQNLQVTSQMWCSVRVVMCLYVLCQCVIYCVLVHL